MHSWMMIAMSPAAVVTEVTNMDTSACCSVEDTWRVFQCTIVMVMVAIDDYRTRMIREALKNKLFF